jgi:hypothetical protein
MRNAVRAFIIIIATIIISCTGAKRESNESEEAKSEQANQEWISLFDGETLNGWKRYNADEIGDLWKVEEGMIVCYSTGGGEATEHGGSLITVEQFDNFEFMIDWKVSPGGNSGLLYHVVEDTAYHWAYATGPEYQLMDDGDAPERVNSNKLTASSYDMYAASAEKKVNPAGEWNTSKIVYDHGHVEHWLNGEKVLEFQKWDRDWTRRFLESKWTNYPGWDRYEKGSIGLQDHGSSIWFRNIKVRKL